MGMAWHTAERLQSLQVIVRAVSKSPKHDKYLDGEDVLACADDVCHIKLSRQAAVLAVSQELPVEPGVECIVHSLKVKGDPAQHAEHCQAPMVLT